MKMRQASATGRARNLTNAIRVTEAHDLSPEQQSLSQEHQPATCPSSTVKHQDALVRRGEREPPLPFMTLREAVFDFCPLKDLVKKIRQC